MNKIVKWALAKKENLSVAEAIKELKHGLNMQSGEFAERFGLTRTALFRYEKGDLRPGPDRLLKLLGATLESEGPDIVARAFIDQASTALGIRKEAVLLAALFESEKEPLNPRVASRLIKRAAEILDQPKI